MATIEFDRTIRGTEVRIFADSFDGDPSTGVGFGPEELWAKTHEGEEFELTDEEIDSLSVEATEIYEGDRCPGDVSISFGGGRDLSQLGTPISQLSGRPGEPGWEEFCRIARSWGYD
jgi:hypothetical protein